MNDRTKVIDIGDIVFLCVWLEIMQKKKMKELNISKKYNNEQKLNIHI